MINHINSCQFIRLVLYVITRRKYFGLVLRPKTVRLKWERKPKGAEFHSLSNGQRGNLGIFPFKANELSVIRNCKFYLIFSRQQQIQTWLEYLPELSRKQIRVARNQTRHEEGKKILFLCLNCFKIFQVLQSRRYGLFTA